MGVFDLFRTRDIDFENMIEFGTEDIQEKIHMKRLAIQTCVNMITKSICQTEFKTIGDVEGADEILYKLNVRPNINYSSSEFWQKVVSKLIYDNEVLIVRNDQDDLLIADSFEHVRYAMVDDSFKNVVVADFEFKRTFMQREVIHITLNNDHLINAVDGLFSDYGELFGRLMEYQKRKGQIRGIVKLEGINARDEGTRAKIEEYVKKVFQNFTKNSVSIIPQQKGMEYSEINSNQYSASVEEIDKVTGGFLTTIQKALGIPQESTDADDWNKKYMAGCVKPLLKKLTDELNGKMLYKKEYLAGGRIKAVNARFNSVFDLATSVDKLISSGFATINEMREEAGWHPSTDEIADKHFITKNYTELEEGEASRGGDNE